MRKLLLCLVIGLSAVMLFAVDITSEVADGSWDNNGDFSVTFELNEESLNYVKVGFSDEEITAASTGAIADINTAKIASTETNGNKFSLDASNSEIWVYYQVKTDKNVTLSLSAESLKADSGNNDAAENAREIPFYIGVTPVGTDAESLTTINSETNFGSAIPVLKYTNGTSDAADSVKLDIYTTLNDIPVGADGAYTGKIKLSVSTNN